MKIKKLTIGEKTFKFTSKYNLIYSRKNSAGKTSLIRLILYSLGYPIPSTKGINFSDLNTNIIINSDKKDISLHRKDRLIKIKQNNNKDLLYSLPDKQIEVISCITGDITEPKVLENILGITYFDQDKGWSLLNRGIVIGKYPFKIESLIDGLANNNLLTMQNKLSEEKEKRKAYLEMSNLLKLKEERKRNLSNINWTDIDDLQSQVRSISLQFDRKKEKIDNLEYVYNGNIELGELLKRFNFVIEIGKEKKKLTSSDIYSYDTTNAVLSAQIAKEKKELDSIRIKKNNLETKLNNQQKLISYDDQIEKFNQEIDKISITNEMIDNKLKENRKNIYDINNKITNLLSSTSQTQEIYKVLIRFAQILDITDIIKNNKNVIFTKNLKIYSGAKLHLFVFALRLSLLKVVQRQFHKTFPIIIDSPMSGEVDDSNIKKMFKLLDNEFSDNQIIVASIYKFKRNWENIISLAPNNIL